MDAFLFFIVQKAFIFYFLSYDKSHFITQVHWMAINICIQNLK